MFTLTRIIALLVVEIAVCIGTLFRPFYGVLFLLLLIFIRPQDDRPNMQELHYPAFVMGAIIVSTLLRQPQIQKRLTSVLSCLAPFIVILALMWISGRVNGYTPESAFQITEFLTNLIFCSLLVFWIDSEKRFTWTIVALLLAGVYYVRQILGDPRIFREEIGGQRFERVALRNLVNFGNPNYLALLMILVVFLALSMLAMKLTIWKKLAVSGAILAYLYVFLKCQSRGASVAF